MAPDPAAQRTHRTEIQLRFADTDALGHVNNVSFAVFAEVARLDFVRTIEQQGGSIILAHLAMDLRRQVHFGADVHVESWAERMGNTSLTLRQDVVADGAVAAEIRSVVVWFDYETQQPRPWPDSWREALAPYLAS